MNSFQRYVQEYGGNNHTSGILEEFLEEFLEELPSSPPQLTLKLKASYTGDGP
jgi:hypothetical protein